ncbi:hypothetical protein WJX73_007615 [Symbiochloris irregularis]|uniref:RING-type domain-containing protein n=1 Tax=Symbiochloris irregularis TaxID=706552 RepID=A0AAW1PUF6_9CHLO
MQEGPSQGPALIEQHPSAEESPPVALVECAICLCPHEEADMITILPCQHRICKDSARIIILEAIKCASALLYYVLLGAVNI